MLTEKQVETLKTVWFVSDDFRVIEYEVREAWADNESKLHLLCAYGKHHKQSKWIPCESLFATSADAYRHSAGMMRKRAAALVAEAERRERCAAAPNAAEVYAQFIKASK
jgi:hypothetical protein